MTGKSQFALLFLCAFTLNIESGFALRCYGCKDADALVLFGTLPKNAPTCGRSFGKEFDCENGSCAKVVDVEGNSKFVKKGHLLTLAWLLLL